MRRGMYQQRTLVLVSCHYVKEFVVFQYLTIVLERERERYVSVCVCVCVCKCVCV